MAIIKTSPLYVVVALEQAIIVFVQNDGNIFTYNHDYKSATKAAEQEVDSAAFSPNHNFFAALYSDKTLTVWRVEDDGNGFEQLFMVDVCRRATSVTFDSDEASVYVADKAGDLYLYKLKEKPTSEDIEPVLGHVSMLLDLAVTEKFIITADRDEKLRVSDKKSPYLIQSFCLGHKEFVCKAICLDEKMLLSLSGDGTARMWNFVSGKQSQVLEIVQDIEQESDDIQDGNTNSTKLVPSLVAFNSTHNLIVIGCIKDNKLGVYKISNNLLQKVYDIKISDSVSIDFDCTSSILYVLHETESNLQVTMFKCSYDSCSVKVCQELTKLNVHLAMEKNYKVKSYVDLFKPPMNGTKKYVDFFKKKNEGKLFCKPNPKKAKVADDQS